MKMHFSITLLIFVTFLTTKCDFKLSDDNGDTFFSEQTLSFLQEGDDFIELRDTHKDIILFLGNSGSGKSSLAHFISGDNDKMFSKPFKVSDGLESEEDEDDADFYIDDGSDKISDKVLLSKTIFPELLVDDETNNAIYDCPGFKDTRNESMDIAASYFIHKVFGHANQVKLLFAINYNSVKPGATRHDLSDLIKHAAQMFNSIKNMEKYENSMVLIATKVKSKNSDSKIIKLIGNYLIKFMKEVDEVYHNKPDIKEKVLKILEIFTKKDNSNFINIGLFRMPREEGKLSGIKSLQETKPTLRKLIFNQIQFTSIAENDFGFSIADSSKLIIQNLVHKIQKEGEEAIKNIELTVKRHVQKYLKSSNDVLAIGLFANQLNDNFQTFLTNTKPNSKSYYSDMLKVISKLNITTTLRNKFMTLDQKYYQLNFFQTLYNSNFNIPTTWTNPINEIKIFFEIISKFYSITNLINVKLSENIIQLNKEKYSVENLEDWGKGGQGNILITAQNFDTFLNNLDITDSIETENLNNNPILLTHLNQVVSFNLHDNTKIKWENKNTLLVEGTHLILSKILPNLNENTTIKLFSSYSIFVDVDIELLNDENKNYNLIFISPNWIIIDSRKIILNGKNADSYNTKAPDVKSAGANGNDGKPGLPGCHGGNFFGLGTQFTNGYNLHIISNGGNAGKGQDGSNGARGQDAQKMTYSEVSGLTIIDSNQSPTSCWGTISVNTDYYCIYRSKWRGTQGGKGGNGGVSGTPGNHGIIKIIDSGLAGITIVTNNGKDAQFGIGGKRGDNGIEENILYTLRYRFDRPKNHVGKDFLIRQEFLKLSGSIDGESNTNKNGMITYKQTYTNITDIISYKQFVINYNYYIYNPNSRISIIKSINENEYINKDLYNVNAFITEINMLEESYNRASVYNKATFLYHYESFHYRLKQYITNTNIEGKDLKKVFTYLYIASGSKMFYLSSNFANSLIIDFSGHIKNIKYLIEELKDTQQTLDKVNTINDRKISYDKQFQSYIIECRNIIKSLNIEIENILSNTNKIFDNLYKEIKSWDAKIQENTKKQAEYRKQMEEVMEKKLALGALQTFTKSLSIFGGVGHVLALGASTGISITQLELEEPEPVPAIKIPASVDLDLTMAVIDISFTNPITSQLIALNETMLKFSKELILESDDSNKDLLTQVNLIINKISNFNLEEDEYGLVISSVEKITDIIKQRIVQDSNDNNRQKRNAIILHRRLKRNVTAEVKKIDYAHYHKTISDTVSSTVATAQTYKDDRKKIEAANIAIESNEEMQRKLQHFATGVSDKLVPLMSKFKRNLNSALSSGELDSKSLVSLDYAVYTITKALNELKLKFKIFLNEFISANDFILLIEKIDDAFKLLLKIYSRIQEQKSQQELTNYITDITSPVASKIQIKDEILKKDIDNLNLIIKGNLILERYNKIIANFKQWVFPFAEMYFEDSLNLAHNKLQIVSDDKKENFENLLSHTSRMITLIEQKIVDFNSSIIPGFHENIKVQIFNSKYIATTPFYVWKNKENKNEILNLINGNEILLKAEILNMETKNALKFTDIEVNFKAHNVSKQGELNEILNHFDIEMTHMGNSQYRCSDKYFTIYTDPQKLSYSFSKDEFGHSIRQNLIQSYLIKKSYILSPYTYWKLQLVLEDSAYKFSYLNKFKDEFDIELIGRGQYLVDNSKVCSSELEKYYTPDDMNNYY